jgi:hypothetical protein
MRYGAWASGACCSTMPSLCTLSTIDRTNLNLTDVDIPAPVAA